MNPDGIQFDLEIGGKRRHIKIYQPFGCGEVWYIFIDNYLHGQLQKVRGEWRGEIRKSKIVYADDIAILGGIIDEHHNLR